MAGISGAGALLPPGAASAAIFCAGFERQPVAAAAITPRPTSARFTPTSVPAARSGRIGGRRVGRRRIRRRRRIAAALAAATAAVLERRLELLDLAARGGRPRARPVRVDERLVALDRLLLVALLPVRLGHAPHRRLVARRDAERGAEAVGRARELAAVEVAVAEPGQRLDARRVGVEHLAVERHRALAV